MKRLFDLVTACAGLLLTWPALILLVVLIRLESPGPGIFRQNRVGRHGRVFCCYKLRTMYRDTPNAPTHLASGNQVTRLGKRLRSTKLDELPQLWNIVVGEMSFVGPRPCLPEQKELIQARERLGVLDLLPGITGLAQVRGIDMSDPERLAELDADYLRTQSLALDLKLIYQTVFERKGKGDRIVSDPDRSK